MPHDDSSRMARVCLEKALGLLHEAEVIRDIGFYNTSAGRSYYAVFYAMKVIFALDRKEYKKHSAMISFFSKDYIKAGTFDKRLGSILQSLSDLRNASDYDEEEVFSPEEATEALRMATEFLDVVKRYVEDRIDNVIE